MADPTPKPEASPAPEPQAPINSPETPQPPAVDEEKETLRKENAELKFGKDLSEVSKRYPAAIELQDDIKKLVNEKGYTVEDASLVILNKAGKLVPPSAPAQRPQGSSGYGGSMDTPPPMDKKAPQPGEPGAIEYYTKQFKDLEGKGEIRVT